MPSPNNQGIDRFANTCEDYHQDRQVLAVEYYGNAWERLSDSKQAKVDKWYRKNREQYQSATKRQGRTVRSQRDYPLPDRRRPVLSYDVRRCLEMLWREFPDEIVDAAFGMIEQQEACEMLGLSKHTVAKRVDACRTKARNLLGREFEQKDWLRCKQQIQRG